MQSSNNCPSLPDRPNRQVRLLPVLCHTHIYIIFFISRKLSAIKVPFGRRTRPLDQANWKAAEWRNLFLIYFPIVLETLLPRSLERSACLQLSLVLRLLLLPQEEFDYAGYDLAEEASIFYVRYESAFGIQQCASVVHALGAHAEEFRRYGPASNTSTFIFEDLYGKITKWWQPGTMSGGKQILEGALQDISRPDYHYCKKPIKYNNHETSESQSNCFYTFSPNTGYRFYLCKHVLETGRLLCSPIQVTASILYEQKFHKVGAFCNAGISPDLVEIPKAIIAGPAQLVDQWVVSVPINAIYELGN